MRLEDMAEPPTVTASTNIDPETLGFIPGVKEKKETVKGYKDCELCEGTGEIECALEVFGNTIWDGKTVACPVCLKKRYEKRIKELKGG